MIFTKGVVKMFHLTSKERLALNSFSCIIIQNALSEEALYNCLIALHHSPVQNNE